MSETLKIGVIGTGMIGQDHIRRISEVLTGATVTAITDVDQARAKEVAASRGAHVFPDAGSLIASDDVDAMLVCSWGPAHIEAILPALNVGKPVFVEKPLATSQQDCLKIIEAEVALGRRLIQVGYMRRYDDAYKAMIDAIAQGAIGAPLMYHGAHRNASVPPYAYTDDMAISDTLVHDIDVARFIMNDEVARIRIISGKKNTIGGELRDPILAIMEMAGGGVVSVEVSVNIGYGYDIRGEVSGEKGTIELAESNKVVVKSGDCFTGRVPADWRERFIKAYDTEIQDFIDMAKQGRVTGPSAWDGYAIQVVSDAGIVAGKTGETVPCELVAKPALYS